MSIRLAAFRLMKNGRFLIRHIHRNQKKIASLKDTGDGGAHSVRIIKTPPGKPSFVQQVTTQARRVVVDAVLNRVTHTVASDLRRRVTQRLLFGDSTPFFALVGVSLASGAGIITKDDELEAVCWEIRVSYLLYWDTCT
jgi:PTEN induced putative kinase 1